MVLNFSSQLNQLMTYLNQTNQSTSCNNGPFDSSTNEGWGANAYLNSNGSIFSYTKETTTGNTISGANNKNLSLDSALAFSEMALKTTDGKIGNLDGKVSIEEFNTGSGSTIGTILDIDQDGFVNRSELTSYYLLIDSIDGNFDGRVNQNAGNLFKMLATIAPETIKTMLKSNNDQIEEADSTFTLNAPVIDGQTGSYDKNDIVGRGANVGAEAAKLSGNKKLFTDIQYIQKDQAGELNLNSGLAGMTELLKSQDRNCDGKVSVYENRLSGGTAVDINEDGFISAGELLAEEMTWDKNNDGKITYEERLYGQKLSQSDDYSTKIKQSYDDKKINDAESTFQMPEKTNNNVDFIQKLFELIMQLLGLNIAK
ncbi:MAG: hypothetical protein A2104_00610 [Candidatus Melainabacteria bacterium GWF2_32_7]|nr:MAG: hypothetical protein A2104_00610 [Candidatus Melainabacteria bacterium GWF2_32_7]